MGEEIPIDAQQSNDSTTSTLPKWFISLSPVNFMHDLHINQLTTQDIHPLQYKYVDTNDCIEVEKEPNTLNSINKNAMINEKTVTTMLNSSIDITRDQDKINKQNDNLIQLQEGDLDPLGVFSTKVPIEKESKISLKDKHVSQLEPSTSLQISNSLNTKTTMKSNTTSETEFKNSVKERWNRHKDLVLNKLESETSIFKIKASLIDSSDLEFTSSSAIYTSNETNISTDSVSVIKRTRSRLEQLERQSSSGSSKTQNATMVRCREITSTNENERTIEISQNEYIQRIRVMHKDLSQAWEMNEKVVALRIAIKCIKLLSDTTSCPHIYPYIFILVSSILDSFGLCVFERIKQRANEDDSGKPLPTRIAESFTSDDIHLQAKETCRNWFYKTACIRELLPRIYIEIALLRCYRFLCDGEFPQIIARISNMIKGIGDPLVAVYCRQYLALSASELVVQERDNIFGLSTGLNDPTSVYRSLEDYFFTFQQFELNRLEPFLLHQNMTYEDYLSLHSPAVEWLMQCAANSPNSESNSLFEDLLAHYVRFSGNSMVLKHICEFFGAKASKPLELLEIIRTASSSQFSKNHIYAVLAGQLVDSKHMGQLSMDEKLQFLNQTWTDIAATIDIVEYMECGASFMKLIVSHYSVREAMVLLKDVVRHINAVPPEVLTVKVYGLLGNLLESSVHAAHRDSKFFTQLIPSTEFLALMGIFKREASVTVAKKVLHAFVSATVSNTNNNVEKGKSTVEKALRLQVRGAEAAVAQALFVICCRVHDDLDSLSSIKDLSDATRDISAFITRLGTDRQDSFWSDTAEVEARLAFYIDCRRAFYKLEPLKELLSTIVLGMAMQLIKAGRSSNGRKQKEEKLRLNCIRACIAFAHVTIPAIGDPMIVIKNSILAGNVALISNCLPQLEDLLKLALKSIADLKNISDGEYNELELIIVVQKLVSLLVYAPSLNDENPFMLIDALDRALGLEVEINKKETKKSYLKLAPASRIQVLIMLLKVYSIWGMPMEANKHFPCFDANYILFAGDGHFELQVAARFSSIVDQIIREIEVLNTCENGVEICNGKRADILQVYFMLEFINYVSPILSLDDNDSHQKLIVTGKKRRFGPTLLKKCMIFTGERMLKVLNEHPSTEKRVVKEIEQIFQYYEATRNYLLLILAQKTSLKEDSKDDNLGTSELKSLKILLQSQSI